MTDLDDLDRYFAAAQSGDQTDPPPSFVLGETMPDETNVGLSGDISTVVTDERVTVSEHVRDTRFTGWVWAEDGASFTNCDFDLAHDKLWTTQDHVNCRTPVEQPRRFTRCRFAATRPQSGVVAVMGHHYTLDRCEILAHEDGAGIHNPDGRTDVELLGTWIHDHAYFARGAGVPSDGAHTDCVQTHGTIAGLRIVGSRLDAHVDPDIGLDPPSHGRAMSCVMFSPVGDEMADVLIDRSWLTGGHVHLNWAGWRGHQLDNVNVTDSNRWGDDTRDGSRYAHRSDLGLALP